MEAAFESAIGKRVCVDVTVIDAGTGDMRELCQRAVADGNAALRKGKEDRKSVRYLGPKLLSIVVEAVGKPDQGEAPTLFVKTSVLGVESSRAFRLP